MAKKDNTSLETNIAHYTDYFKEDLDAIEEELEKSKAYSKIIDSEVDKLSAPSLGANKGSQHYLIEHITNAVQLQTQRQGLRRDRFAIKKAIIDYAAKFADEKENNSTEDMMVVLEKMLKERNNINIKHVNTAQTINSSIDLDAEIDSRLENNN